MRRAAVLAVFACGLLAPAGHAAAIFDVTNTNDGGPGSLRAAITSANGSSGKDLIRFFVTGTISLTSGPLPVVTDPVVIDGRTAPGYSGSPVVRVDNATGNAINGFEVSAGSTELRAFSITRFGNGIVLETNGADIVAGNWIGLDLSGNADGNDDGIVASSNTNTIGGTTAADRNVISGNTGDGVTITGSGATGNLVEGNYVGTTTDGAAAEGNGGQGIVVSSSKNDTLSANVVSGNGQDGIRLAGAGASSSRIESNLVGTDALGTAAIANGADGIALLDGASFNTVGGGASNRNVVSGNGHAGISIAGGGTRENGVAANFIGTSADGLSALPNTGSGVAILSGATNNSITRNVISGNGLHGVQIAGAGTSGNSLGGNSIGLNANQKKLSNGGSGVSVEAGASANEIGGGRGRNVISGNAENGVAIVGAGTTANTVADNRIGTNRRAEKAIGNGFSGVLIADDASQNTIGGGPSNAINVISGNGFAGVEIRGSGCAADAVRLPVLGVGTTANVVSGNFIGTGWASGSIPNDVGVAILAGASGNTVGGTGSGQGNLISANKDDGVLISDCGTSNNVVEGNDIGTTYGAGGALPNGGDGVRITSNASQNTVGGGARNVISGNTKQGVAIQAAQSNVVLGNYIGTNANATAAVPNGKDGVSIFSGSVSNLVGGTTPQARNVISGNVGHGVTVGGDGTSQNVVQGNYVGTGGSGTTALPNDTGIAVQRGASQNTVGGTAAGAGNVISGNTFAGILLTDDGGTPPGSTSGNLIQGNLVGTDANGTAALPNGQFGVIFTDGPKSNTLGGTQAGARNVIAFNDGDGVRVENPTAGFTTFGDSILQNAIFDNAGLGISLLPGGNDLQPAPKIKSVTTSGGTTTVKARLTGSAPSTQFRIELYSNPVCDASGAGEGKDFIAAKTITTDTSGAKTFAINVPAVGPGLALTETATNLANADTSEFSTCATSP
jgi:parallel beta-helix repeat protein